MLEQDAISVLKYMALNGLVANANKTTFFLLALRALFTNI